MRVRTAASLVLCSALATSVVHLAAQRDRGPINTEPYTIWPVEQLSKPGNLGNFGHYRASVQRRDVGSAPEVHPDFAHVMVFTSGEGAFVIGGEIVDGPNGTKVVKGGETLKIALGAVYHISINAVHWVVPNAGSSVTYFVTNINVPGAKP